MNNSLRDFRAILRIMETKKEENEASRREEENVVQQQTKHFFDRCGRCCGWIDISIELTIGRKLRRFEISEKLIDLREKRKRGIVGFGNRNDQSIAEIDG